MMTKPKALLAVLVLLSVASTVSAQTDVVNVGSDKQLFLGPWAKDGRDTHLVESMTKVSMTTNPARVTGERLVELDQPWEGDRLMDLSMFVLRDGETFRMYYGALAKYPMIWAEPNCRILCYAESKDGIHWEKPNLGLFEWKGSRKNNIILPNDDFKYVMSEFAGPGVFIDPQAKRSEEKYKLIMKMTPVRSFSDSGIMDRRRDALNKLKELGVPVDLTSNEKVPDGSATLRKAQYMFSSPDGIRWTLMSTQKVNPGASDTHFSVFWDDHRGEYITYTRVKGIKTVDHPVMETIKRFYKARYASDLVCGGRMVGRISSRDLQTWSPEQVVLATDILDHTGLTSGFSGVEEEEGVKFGGAVDIYGGNVSKYSDAANAYIALPTMFYHWKKTTLDISGKAIPNVTYPATLDVQLATSRDGSHWNRSPQRKPFIAVGPRGSWWSKMIWPSGNVIRVGDELWIYFAGYDVAHNMEQDALKSKGAYGRAVLRLDGFISADANYSGGELVTKPLIFGGSKLQLNVDTGAGGIVRVEILDENGKPIPEFSRKAADGINGNYIRVLCSWKQTSDVSSLAGKPVRLRFLMRNAKLYSFQFVP